MYIAHNKTAMGGGHIIGVFDDYNKAKECLKKYCRMGENTTDWGHFIRYFDLNEPFFNVWFLPQTNKDGTPNYNKPKRREIILGVPVVDNQVVL